MSGERGLSGASLDQCVSDGGLYPAPHHDPRIKTLAFRIPLLLLHSLAMFAFGSRAATVLTALFAIGYIGSRMFKGLATGRLKRIWSSIRRY